MHKTVSEIAKLIGGTVAGDGQIPVEGITNLEAPRPGFLTFVTEPDKIRPLEATEISCILAPPGTPPSGKKTLILVDNPKLAWAKLLRVFVPPRVYPGTLSNQALISKSAEIGRGVTIEPFAFIGEKSRIGDGSAIRSGVYVDQDVAIGKNTVIHPNVTIYEGTRIGNEVIIHAGTVIGSDGFGYVFTGKEHFKVPQVGCVIIEDQVEIGANVTIDRATVGATMIRRGTKIDNLVQIAHNVEMGELCVASSQVGISGSSKIGKGVILAGQVGIADHCEVGDGAILGAQAGLPSKKKVPPGQIFFGSPARPYEQARKALAAQGELAAALKKIRELQKRVSELEKEARELREPL